MEPAGQPPRSSGIWTARAIAAAADLVQIAVFPFFFQGLLSPANAVLDVLVGIILTMLVGWHLVFLPTFVMEQLPIADLAPTWTLAVLWATRPKASGEVAVRR